MLLGVGKEAQGYCYCCFYFTFSIPRGKSRLPYLDKMPQQLWELPVCVFLCVMSCRPCIYVTMSCRPCTYVTPEEHDLHGVICLLLILETATWCDPTDGDGIIVPFLIIPACRLLAVRYPLCAQVSCIFLPPAVYTVCVLCVIQRFQQFYSEWGCLDAAIKFAWRLMCICAQ